MQLYSFLSEPQPSSVLPGVQVSTPLRQCAMLSHSEMIKSRVSAHPSQLWSVRNSPYTQGSTWYLHRNASFFPYLGLLDVFLLSCAQVSLLLIRTEFECEPSLPPASGFPYFGVPTSLLQPGASIKVNSEAMWTEFNASI